MEASNMSDCAGEGESSDKPESTDTSDKQSGSGEPEAIADLDTGDSANDDVDCTPSENAKRFKIDDINNIDDQAAATSVATTSSDTSTSVVPEVEENEDLVEINPDRVTPVPRLYELADDSQVDSFSDYADSFPDIIRSSSFSSVSATDVDCDDDDDDDETESPVEYPIVNKKLPDHNWFILPEIQNRQLGTSANKQSPELFQRRCYGSLHYVQRMKLFTKLETHTGCVNAISFHPNGDLLASGSDDLEIVLWDWKQGRCLLEFDSNHKNNVFHTKFIPLNGDDLHLVSCARDGQVRLAQVSAQEGFRSSRRLGAHRGPCHKLTVLPDRPQVVISVGEDCVVMRHDLRCTKSAKLHTAVGDTYEVPLYSISTHPLNTDEYCVGGRDYIVRTYDLRQPGQILKQYHPFEEQRKSIHVTCAVYNHNGSEILASYNDEDIYIFDINSKPGSYVHSYSGHRNGATIKGVNFFGPKSEFVISGSDCGYIYFWEKETETIVQLLHGDVGGVVNCLEPHPQLPFLCSSGLDTDIKVWMPLRKKNSKLKSLVRCLTVNKRPTQWTLFPDTPIHGMEMRWIQWRGLQGPRNIRLLFNAALDDSSNHSTSSSSSSSSSSSDSSIPSIASTTSSVPDGFFW